MSHALVSRSAVSCRRYGNVVKVPLQTLVAAPAGAQCTGTASQCSSGQFGNPFDEPTLLGQTTSERCLEDNEGKTRCKPTAGTLVALGDDRFLYWNALEGTEDVEVSLVAEF